ncbi:MAG: PD-(D/E)XK nuclease family protein [Candidatus Omnitrophota bacterium]|nr:PD-(D/E)XK nuclease family protein [Candidatus Omnitrophota bacterium]
MSRINLFPNVLTLELEKLSQEYACIEKILIVPNYQIGHQILERLVRSGVSWINFTLATPTALAIGLVEDVVISNNLELLSASMSQIIVDSIFNSLFDSHKLSYFEKHPINKGMVEALARTISDLRSHGVSSQKLSKNGLVSLTKENDIMLLLAEYEKALNELKFIDAAGLFSLALEHGNQIEVGERKYIIPERYYMRGMERKLIDKIARKNLIIIPEDPIFGLASPLDGWLVKEQALDLKVDSNIRRLKWLFDLENVPPVLKDSSIEIFNAVGERNEIREVLRRIVKNNAKIDEAEIVYTDSDKYLDLIYCFCEKISLSATYSEGAPFYITNAGRSLMGFLLWVKEDFQEIYLRRILESGALKIESQEEDLASSSILGHLLRTSGVGWGRERYDRLISKRIKELKKIGSYNEKDGEQDQKYLEGKIKNLGFLLKICNDLLLLVPKADQDKKINFARLCQGLEDFLEKYVKIFNDNDAFFVANAKERISRLGKVIQGTMAFEEAIEKLINIVSNIRLTPSGPKPGHLHVSHYKSGARTGRMNTFIVGLDESKFPEKIVQDPILLDEERIKVNPNLELSSDRLRKNIYEMAALIVGLRGKVTFSYPTYDIREDRKSFPSSILLQVFRIKEGNSHADYNTLQQVLGQPVVFSGFEYELDQTDWWLNKLVDGVLLKNGLIAVEGYFPCLKEGLIAFGKRTSDEFSEYDGKVNVDSKEVDPRTNKSLVMSCSRIETIAKCPFAYFLKYLIGVSKPDESEKDLTIWLDSAQKGTLLHEVFRGFTEETSEGKKELSFNQEKQVIMGILEKIVQEFKEEIPPPSEVVFQNEFTQLKRDVGVFLKINESLETKPVKWEISFGEKEGVRVTIPLSNGSEISLRGRIDRIDQVKASEYHVWDYKTGSSYEFDESHYINQGTQLQHGLYAVAAEKILQVDDKKAKVTISGYLLPTEKGIRDGKGGKFPKDTVLKEKWQEAMNIIFDIVKTGTFMRSDCGDGCKFCDYTEVCGGDNSKIQILSKLKNNESKELQLWQKLKEYD